MVHRKLSAHDHRRPSYADPASIMLLVGHDAGVTRGLLDRLMIGGIKEFDDHPVIDNGVRDPDLFSAASGQSFRKRGLSITWWSIEEDSSVAIDRGAYEIKPRRFVRDIAKRRYQLLFRNRLEGARLGLDA